MKENIEITVTFKIPIREVEALEPLFRNWMKSELQALTPPVPNEVQYISRKNCAALLHISLGTLNDFTKRGIIQGHRLSGGTRVLYIKQEILDSVKKIQNVKYRRGVNSEQL